MTRPPEYHGGPFFPEPEGNGRGTVIHGNPARIAGSSWTHALYYFVLLAAAVVDIVVFHQVLLDAFDETEETLWGLAGGFTLVALALSHTAGQQAKHGMNPRNPPGTRSIAVLCLVGWIVLGVVAFIFRYIYIDPANTATAVIEVEGQPEADPSAATDTNQHLSAVLFMSFFVATGVVSGSAGFLRHDPDARQYARALSRRRKAAGDEARFRSVLAAAEETAVAIKAIRTRMEDAWADAERQCEDAATRLKQEFRLRLLARETPDGQEGQPGMGEEYTAQLRSGDGEPNGETSQSPPGDGEARPDEPEQP
jgi:hypothetical protein